MCMSFDLAQLCVASQRQYWEFLELGFVELGFVELGFVDLGFVDLGFVELEFVNIFWLPICPHPPA